VSPNTCIASLEAELNASQRAYDVATAAKASAEKLHKSALAKVKKAEKSLAYANKEHLQREQALAEHLNTMSAAAGGACYTIFPSSVIVVFLHLLKFSFPAIFLSPLLYRIYQGVFVDSTTRR
jgi:hypothetical protein